MNYFDYSHKRKVITFIVYYKKSKKCINNLYILSN